MDDLNSSLSLLPQPNISFPLFPLAIPLPQFSLLMTLYIIVILSSSSGSILVITAVLRSPNLRTHSNFFLVNLAVSDLLLVLVACPTTFLQISSTHWPLPLIPSLCKLSTFLPLFFSFASTFSICMISLDRHQLIVHTQHPGHRTAVLVTSIAAVWLAALLAAAPIIPNTALEVEDMDPRLLMLMGVKERAYCMEDWVMEKGR